MTSKFLGRRRGPVSLGRRQALFGMRLNAPGRHRQGYQPAAANPRRMRNPSTLDIRLFESINRRHTSLFLDWLLPRITHAGLGGVQLPLVALVWWAHRGTASGDSFA